jgi:hypothetical protein
MKRQDLKAFILFDYYDFDSVEMVAKNQPLPEGAQLVDGQWYAPLDGCDTLEKIIDRAESLRDWE